MRVRGAAEVILVVWLLGVGVDYAGFIELPGLLADLGLLTLVILIGYMAWKYLIRREKAHG